MQVAALVQEKNTVGIQTVIELLSKQFGDRFSTGKSLCEQHAHTTSWTQAQAPDGVVFAISTQEVSEIVKICAKHLVPVIPFGAGSSLEGHVNAPYGGISLDVSRMNAIVCLNAEDLDVRVQPGVTRKQLNEYLRATGLFFPIDPGADASIGGMTATRASGTNAVRYGTMKDVVLAVEVVMPDGSIIRTGGRAKKSSAGYDLTRLLIGSEGTLGVITEITLKLTGIPETIAGGRCTFPDLESACNATIMTIQCGIPVARIELLDTLQVQASNAYSKLELEEAPTLFLEFHGTKASVAEQSDLFQEIASDFGGGNFIWTTDPEERNKIWQARHDAYWASRQLRPECDGVSTDICVPISRLAECVGQSQADLKELDLFAPTVGHVGDGNFHMLILVNTSDDEEMARVKTFLDRLSERAIAMEGTCTGEHGIGQGKIKYMKREHGAALDVMQSIKDAIDPNRIMNPGKILPQSQ